MTIKMVLSFIINCCANGLGKKSKNYEQKNDECVKRLDSLIKMNIFAAKTKWLFTTHRTV